MKTKILILIFLSIIQNGFAQKTLEDLQEAYQEEANAAHQFDLYSDQASKDGYDDLSRLFCAIAKGDYIQMQNHRKMLKKFGKDPLPVKYQKIKVGSNAENLKNAIKDEAKEKLSYKKFTSAARKEGMQELATSFKKEKKVEVNHENLLKKALFNLDKNIPQDYYVSNQTGEIIWNCQCVGQCKCKTPPKPKQEGEILVKF